MPTPDAHQALTDRRNLDAARAKFGDHLDRALDWAQGNLPAEELAQFNLAMDGPAHGRDAAIGKLIQRHIAAAHDQRLQQAQQAAVGGNPSGVQPFATPAERADAVGDPRYLPTLRNGSRNPNFDPAYAADVKARLVATHNARPAHEKGPA